MQLDCIYNIQSYLPLQGNAIVQLYSFKLQHVDYNLPVYWNTHDEKAPTNTNLEYQGKYRNSGYR